ncbi:hypothetical protein CYCD_29300 [Tenuifilaceae bacterium CYCD]|nr:hypothetical protein CYCD_29300 [Tenuifilaceae bacterium CYCD]
MYVALILVVSFVILLTGRFERVASSFSNFSWNNLKKTEIRFAIWDETLHLVRSKPILGYGIGDAKPELVKQYNRDNISIAKDNEYNTHNEFLEVLLQFGLVGLAILLAILFYPIYASKVDMQLYLFFITLVSLHFIFESMLERIAGVSFIMYFYSYINTIKLKYDTIFTAKN